MRKVAIAIAVAWCALASLAGCSNATYENESGEVSERFDDGGWRLSTANIITDKSTGVEYLVVECTGGDISVCPLYNPDGTLCTETADTH